MKFFKRLFNKWWFWALIGGAAIRLLLMPITAHPDLWGHSFTAYFFAYKGELNIYDFLLSLPKTHPLVANYGVNDIFIYPPLAYFTLGIFRVLVKPFADPAFIPWLMNNVSSYYNYPTIGLQIFLFKIPYLFVDIASAFLLSDLFDDKRKKKLAFVLWMFNPITIYATFMIGQLDILPVFFTILSCYLIKQGKWEWGLFSLGIGGAYKMYPLLLIPPAAFVLGKNFWDRVKLMVVGFLPYLATIAPYLWSKGFRAMVLFSSKDTKMLFMDLKVTAAEGVFPFIALLFLVYLISYYVKRKLDIKFYFLTILLILFSVTDFHPQWFLWVTPFVIWAIVKFSGKYIELVATLFVCWLVITLLFESSLSYGLFTPAIHSLQNAPSISEYLAKVTDIYQFRSIIRSIFAGASLFYIYSLYKRESEV